MLYTRYEFKVKGMDLHVEMFQVTQDSYYGRERRDQYQVSTVEFRTVIEGVTFRATASPGWDYYDKAEDALAVAIQEGLHLLDEDGSWLARREGYPKGVSEPAEPKPVPTEQVEVETENIEV